MRRGSRQLTEPWEHLTVEIADGVCEITLDRPDKLNALTFDAYADLRDLFGELPHRGDVRAVVLTGRGRGFCSGGDVEEIIGELVKLEAAELLQFTRMTGAAIRAMRECALPIIAAVNGIAAGIGCSFALACDHVIAARSAYVLLSFVNVGLVPDGGASALIPARVGSARFAQLALLGERLPAEQALAWGLVDRMTEDEELLPAAAELAGRLAAGATGAQAAIKRMVNAGPLAGLDAALALEADLQGARGGDPEFHEGVAAFLEKRPPRFGTAPAT